MYTAGAEYPTPHTEVHHHELTRQLLSLWPQAAAVRRHRPGLLYRVRMVRMFCPVECMFQRPDGFYDLDVERCIGCRSCKVNCFYDAITMIQRTRKEDN